MVKMGRPTQNDSFEMGYSSALVCMASTNTSVVPEGVNVVNESGTGMENMIEVCQIGWIILEYSRTAMFHWMFLEGLHLHNILVVNVFLNNSTNNHRLYLMFGWAAPLLATTTWASVTAINMEHRCWFGYNHKSYYWISEGPRLVIIMGNFLFLVNIIRMLYAKVGNQSTTSETSFSQIRTSVKAAIVLQPLLGITNILQIVSNPYDSDVVYFTFWSITTAFLASFQGFFASLFYCFCNKEVQKAIQHWLVVHQSRRQTQSALPVPARSESIKTTRVRLSFKRRPSNLSHKKRPSWCQDLSSSSYQASAEGGLGGGPGVTSEAVGWSPRGRSIDLRVCGTIKNLGKVEEGIEVQAMNL